MKKEIRVLAWDDCSFGFDDKEVRVVGPVFRGGQFMDGLISTTVKKDGTDATEKLSSAILETSHYDQLSVVMLDGITFGGMNVVDIKALRKNTGLPVIGVTRKKPNIKKFLAVLKKFDDYKDRVRAVSNAGNIYTYLDIFYQKDGFTLKECEELLALTCTQSNIPEPLRVAHLIASGLGRQANEVRHIDGSTTT